MTNQELHRKIKSTAATYLQIESELVALLIEMDSRRAFEDWGFPSLFQYCVQELGFSEAVAAAFITVSRKAAHVPELMMALEEQILTVSKAAKITAALHIQCSAANTQTPDQNNKVCEDNRKLIEFASSHSTAETERWLREKRGVDTIHTLKIGSSLMEKLKHVKNLDKEVLSLEEALEVALDEYIQKHDPLEKAKRAESRLQKRSQIQHQNRNKSQILDKSNSISVHSNVLAVNAAKDRPVFTNANSPQNTGYPVLGKITPKRTPIPASIKHQVIVKAKNQCTHEIQPGLRCQNRKFLEIHHLNPVHSGGTNALANLTLLCSAHHRDFHKAYL